MSFHIIQSILCYGTSPSKPFCNPSTAKAVPLPLGKGGIVGVARYTLFIKGGTVGVARYSPLLRRSFCMCENAQKKPSQLDFPVKVFISILFFLAKNCILANRIFHFHFNRHLRVWCNGYRVSVTICHFLYGKCKVFRMRT